MRFFLFFYLFLISCAGLGNEKAKKIYICGDHECKNNKEINDYFKNNISVEVYTITASSKKDKDYDLVELNIPQVEKKNMISIDTKKQQIKERIKNRKKTSKIKIKEGEKNIINKQRNTRPKITLVRICKNLQECDIDEVTKIIFNRGSKKKFPDLTNQ